MERHLGDGTRITRRNILKGAAALGAGVGFIGPWRRARAQGKKAILIGLTCDATGTFADSGQADRRRALEDIPPWDPRSVSPVWLHRAPPVWVGQVVSARRPIACIRWCSRARAARSASPSSSARRICSCSASDSRANPPRRACMMTR